MLLVPFMQKEKDVTDFIDVKKYCQQTYRLWYALCFTETNLGNCNKNREIRKTTTNVSALSTQVR